MNQNALILMKRDQNYQVGGIEIDQPAYGLSFLTWLTYGRSSLLLGQPMTAQPSKVSIYDAFSSFVKISTIYIQVLYGLGHQNAIRKGPTRIKSLQNPSFGNSNVNT